MRVSSLGLSLALFAILVIYIERDLTVQAATSSLFPACNATSEGSLGDGSCDIGNNNAGCEFDAGDCCSCTCADGDYLCGSNGYDCLDPTASNACATSSPSSTPPLISTGFNDSGYPNCSSVVGYIPYIGDGFCDNQNNNEECGYDGGDCCLCTCLDDQYYPCGVNGYDCLDHTVPVECAKAKSPYPSCKRAGGYDVDINDGYCHPYNNNDECGYDGGDCCNCTCVDSDWACGVNGYDCLDPTLSVECANETSPYPKCTGAGGLYYNINDGLCNNYNNIEECGFDGGDCCNCTCVSSDWLCGVNGYDCLDPMVPMECVNATSPYQNCSDAGGYYYEIDDGWCDRENNIEECGYDGGDCCNCTCVDNDWSCGVNGYDCLDPTVSIECTNVTSLYQNCTGAGGLTWNIDDGYCHTNNNIEECGYDGGDCCACTCVDSQWSCGVVAFNCLDPTVPLECANATSTFLNCTEAGGLDRDINDGYCDANNNIEECGYDGGDCCPCTCVDSQWSCGVLGFNCLDPAVPAGCVNATSQFFNCSDAGGSVSSIGNAWCDVENNNQECGYDGGDCCPCTCKDTVVDCGIVGYNCLDPTVPSDCADVVSTSTYDDDGETHRDCEDAGGSISAIGSGYCTGANNNAECGYDGGDCCPCTCVDGSSPCGSNGYDCRDPTVSADCFNPTSSMTYDDDRPLYPDCEDVGGDISLIGNGFCLSMNNNKECGYDGGDCCPCTCVDGPSPCGSNGYDCRDPTASADCSDSYDRPYPDCEHVGGYVSWISDGYCSSVNNNEECGYDGGDCCPCTCVDQMFPCGYNGYSCGDPAIPPDCFEGTPTTLSSSSNSMTSSSNSMTASVSRGDIQCMGDASSIGNGICDVENNNGYCEYDGGDCCWCTCFDQDGSRCRDKWHDCQDPGTNCSEKMRMIGVVILTGFGVFVSMLCCFYLSRSAVVERVRGRRVSPKSGLPPSRPEASSVVFKAGRIARKKPSDHKPSVPPLLDSCALEQRRAKKKAWDRKRSGPTLPPLPEYCALEEGGVEERKTSNSTTWSPPLPSLSEDCAADMDEVENTRGI